MPTQEVRVPDIGDFENVDIIEVLVAPGDSVRKEDSLITLESDKATMEIPSPQAGVVRELKVAVGDKVSRGTAILTLEMEAVEETKSAGGAAQTATPTQEADRSETAQTQAPGREAERPEAARGEAQARAAAGTPAPAKPPAPGLGRAELAVATTGKTHASPSVRRLARELGVDLQRVRGTGPKGRILTEDVQGYIQGALREGPAAGAGLSLPEPPAVDFSRFGETETRALSRIQKLSAANLHRNWVGIPHVTQFDEADITELETFRKSQLEALAGQGVKLTLTAFILKAVVAVLKRFPQVNASLDPGGEQLILKKYYHLGVAVDTPEGLVVPVIRDVDKKGLTEIARELGEFAARARERQLTPGQMQGATFTVSSLGGLGGTGFTPIINAPEVAILGVSRAVQRPIYENGSFVPRLMLPFSLSYDHRVIDGAEAVRFTTALSADLSDVRRILL